MERPPTDRKQSWWYGLFVGAVVVLAVAGYAGYVLYPRFNLPSVNGLGLFVLAAAAGMASFFSPCSFPLLATLLARETTGPSRGYPTQLFRVRIRQSLGFGLALASGASLFLGLVGVVIAFGGAALFARVTFTSTAGISIRGVVGVMLIVLGLIQLERIPLSLEAVEDAALPLLRTQARLRHARPALGFGLLGFGYLIAGFG